MPIKRMSGDIPIDKVVNAKLMEIAKKMGGGVLRVGFLENSPSGTYPDGQNAATVAFLNEFGHGGHFPAPARPFFRTMVAKESPTWPDKMATLAVAYNYDGTKVLELMGKDIEGALYESIVNTNDPPLSDTTLVLRAKFASNPEDIRITDVVAAQQEAASGTAKMATGTGAKPLVWTGRMLRAVGSEVVSK